MNIKNKLIALGVLLVLIVGLIAVGVSIYFNSTREVNCSSSVTYLLPNGYEYSGEVRFAISGNQQGLLAYSGVVSHQRNPDLRYDLLRVIYFDVKYNDAPFFSISNFKVRKNVNDNMQDNDFNKIIFDLSSGPRRLRLFSVDENTYMIGNVFSPVFMCVNLQQLD